MDEWAKLLITVVGTILASNGFWLYLQKRRDKNDARTQLLVGIAHDIIVTRGTSYLERGDWITVDEYENLHDYLYVPYSEAGGNGSAKCVIEDIKRRLRRVSRPPVIEQSGEED